MALPCATRGPRPDGVWGYLDSAEHAIVSRAIVGAMTEVEIPTVGVLPAYVAVPNQMENDLWEKGADWWQRNFTEGADPEYEEQILPLVERYARGARRVLDIGCGEGQVSRRLASQGAEVVGLDVTELADSQGLRSRRPFRVPASLCPSASLS